MIEPAAVIDLDEFEVARRAPRVRKCWSDRGRVNAKTQAGAPRRFLTQEQWITFSAQSGWIEMGQTEGNYIDCCTDRPFFAEETPAHVYHERIAEGTPGTNVYAHYLVYDTEQNAIWRMYWGEWTEEEHYGGWSSVRFQEQEAGTEAASEDIPYENGRDEVARWLNGSSPWYPWSNSVYEVTPAGAFCMHKNQGLQAEGNIEWKVGSC